MTDKRIVFVTVPDQAVGEKIAHALIDERLASCANLIPGLVSIYQWEGRRHREPEVLMVIKTRVDRFESLKERVLQLHPYQCPEIVSVPIEMGFHRYLQWIDGEIGP